MQRVPASLLLIIFVMVSCRTPGKGALSGLSDTEVRNFEDELGMKPGIGFEGVMEGVRGVCVDFNDLEISGNSQEATFSVHLIEKHSDLVAQLGVSSASQIKSAVPDQNIQVSRKSQFVMGNTFSVNRYSVFMLVSARIRNETSHLKDVKLMDSIQTELRTNPADYVDKFRQRCGDSFLSGFTTGGEFHAIIEISSDNDQMTMNLKNSYEANLSFGGASNAGTSGKIDAGIKKVASGRNMRIWTFQHGGAGDDQIGLVTSVDELIGRMKGLADSVKVGNNPRPVTATFADYFTLALDLPSKYRKKLLDAKDIIVELSKRHNGLLDLSGNLDYILTNPQAFIDVNVEKLKQIKEVKNEIDTRIKEIMEAARKCASDYEGCTDSPDTAVLEFSLPKRKPTIESLAGEKIKFKTKLTYINVDALRDGWLNPPECYLQINAGGNGDDNFITVRRTPTTYPKARCSNLQTDIEVPVSIVKDAYKSLGVPLDKGWVEVVLWEDDPSYDDRIGSAYVWFKDLQKGAALKGINNDNINMELGIEIKY